MDAALSPAIVLASYLLGSIPIAYLTGKLLRGIDIRQVGSATAGASNVYQSVARWAVVPVGLLQIGQGMAAVALAKLFDQPLGVQVLAGLAAVGGAAWPVFLGFRGGRGIGASIGFLLVLTPATLVVFVVISLIGVALRGVPLAVGLGIAASPVSALVFEGAGPVAAGCLALAAMIFLKRALANDRRLPQGPDRREVIVNRLLFDRDIRDRDEWVRRGLNGEARR
ncbi:MAG: glycerol-3-phosphate acyltransferase [Dehalococcoidia bacterium]|nr:glycerol-3-phosphate acyltransferase [Dehalococcoidia bacterium]